MPGDEFQPGRPEIRDFLEVQGRVVWISLQQSERAVGERSDVWGKDRYELQKSGAAWWVTEARSGRSDDHERLVR